MRSAAGQSRAHPAMMLIRTPSLENSTPRTPQCQDCLGSGIMSQDIRPAKSGCKWLPQAMLGLD